MTRLTCRIRFVCAVLRVRREYGSVVQLVSTPPCHGGGRGFESLQSRFGIIAQLGEHLPYKQGVRGSSPLGPSTMPMWLNWQSS